MPRPVELLELTDSDLGSLVEWMVRLTAEGDGWINLLPGVPSELVEDRPRPSVLSALFGSNEPPVSMATWMPPGRRRSRPGECMVGILHQRGRHGLAQLRGFGVELPVGWRVRQDHPRRGLVLAVPSQTPHPEVARWALRAVGQLAAVPLTGRWQARVYLPRSTTS